MESGHTPSRQHPEYWGGDIPWIGIKDAKAHHGLTIETTEQFTNELGIKNSSARVLPAGTVCLSRTASVGYVVIMGRPMATSQDFANWVCTSQLDEHFLARLFMVESDALLRFGSGATHQTIYYPELKALHVCLPPIAEQRRIVERLSALEDEVDVLKRSIAYKLNLMDQLKRSFLHKAFTGTLATAPEASVGEADEVRTVDPKSPEFAADVVAIAYQRHASNQRNRTFGRVKAQKTLHLVESIGRIDLGRAPIQDAAGPNDFRHMLKAESWAKANNFFEFVRRGEGYEFQKRHNFAKMIQTARVVTKPYKEQLNEAIDLLVWMDSRQAEVFTTVHAAWNNLLIDGVEVTDELIVREARDNWHGKKQEIPASEFREAIRQIEQMNLVPIGDGKRVGERRLF